MSPTHTSQHGIVLFAHGSRDPQWHQPIQAVQRQIQGLQPDTPVVCAYLELSTPNLAQATEMLMKVGVRAVTIVPLLLGVGKHAREDLPALVVELQAAYPQISMTLRPAVGEDPRLIRLLAEIALSPNAT